MGVVHSPGTLPPSSAGAGSTPAITAEAVREQLQHILASREFRSSPRCQAFLRYVVETTVAGAADTLKERTVGIEVFGRPVSYEPGEDASVRVKAGEVRKRLSQYYGCHPDDSIVIELPLGTYVPEFRRSHGVSSAAAEEVARQATRLLLPRWFLPACLVVAVLVGAVLLLPRLHNRHEAAVPAADPFWGPVFTGQKPVSLCAVAVPVYSRMREPDAKRPARPEDYVLVPDQFVAVGDMSALLQISEMFSRLEQPYRLRIGKDVSFRDLRSGPAVLVGFSYTKWDEISRGFRFFIDLDRQPAGILDNGKATMWTLATHPDDPKIREDYAIVSRVFDPDTHNMLVEIAGISHYGTEAAADFVSNSSLLAEAFRDAPSGWQSKNLQLVLHVNVIGGSPSVPTVLATHFW